jgi:hypothetical protein
MLVHKQQKVSPRQLAANRRNALKSTGPRTPEGKRRVRGNAWKHGRRARTPGRERGEDAGGYEDWREKILAAFAPQDAMEVYLVEELARLGWKRQRVERAQAALQERELEKLELAHLRQLHALNRESLETSEADVAERGLLAAKECTAKFEEALQLLDQVIEQVEKQDWTESFEATLRALYGKQPPWRGSLVLSVYRQLRERAAPDAEQEESLQAGLLRMLHEERRDLLEQYELLRFEQVEITTPLREACLAPADPRWTSLLRQEAIIERQIDRRLRLLERLLHRRAKITPCENKKDPVDQQSHYFVENKGS